MWTSVPVTDAAGNHQPLRVPHGTPLELTFESPGFRVALEALTVTEPRLEQARVRMGQTIRVVNASPWVRELRLRSDTVELPFSTKDSPRDSSFHPPPPSPRCLWLADGQRQAGPPRSSVRHSSVQGPPGPGVPPSVSPCAAPKTLPRSPPGPNAPSMPFPFSALFDLSFSPRSPSNARPAQSLRASGRSRSPHAFGE
jgi:hypothetical protein